MLAHHFTQAGMTEAAIEWWGKAGQRSLERSALVEAVGQLRKGLALVANLLEGVTRMQHELDLEIALGKAMIATKGYVRPRRARHLIVRVAFASSWTAHPTRLRFARPVGARLAGRRLGARA